MSTAAVVAVPFAGAAVAIAVATLRDTLRLRRAARAARNSVRTRRLTEARERAEQALARGDESTVASLFWRSEAALRRAVPELRQDFEDALHWVWELPIATGEPDD